MPAATAELESQAGSAASQALSTRAIGGQVGNVAPDFTASTLDGQQVTLASMKGKPFLLHFVATW
jgi:peroxiredoxin